jgi:transcriptional regulator with XRE-family HTH domain
MLYFMSKKKSSVLEADRSTSPFETNQLDYSQHIGARLSQALMARGWTQKLLAQKLGITDNTLSRMLSGQERLNMNHCCEAMTLLGFSPALLLSTVPIAHAWTGIVAIDQMLADIYGEHTHSGIEAMANYLTKDYLCCSHHYLEEGHESNHWYEHASEEERSQTRMIYNERKHGRNLLGISYELERQWNRANSFGSLFGRQIKNVVLMDKDTIFVISDSKKLQAKTGALVAHVTAYEYCYMKNAFLSISKGAQVRIRRRVWFNQSIHSPFPAAYTLKDE